MAKFEEKMKKDEEQVKALLASLVEKHEAEVISATNGLRHIVTKPGSGDSPRTPRLNVGLRPPRGRGQPSTDRQSTSQPSNQQCS